MCINIYKPEGIKINPYVFENSFAWNPDGAGFLAWDDKNNKLISKKGFFTLEAFMNAFKPYQYKRCAIHFRKITHGNVNKDNCHPFMVNKDLGFIHNGVIHNVKQWDKSFSDTWHFNEAILKPLMREYPTLWQHNTFKYLIQHYISKNSKLIFLSNTGEFKIYNENYGIWDSDCWFSNDRYNHSVEDLSSTWDEEWPEWDNVERKCTQDDLITELEKRLLSSVV